jgi:hypothetical protein
MELHWDILDEKRKAILPLLKHASEQGFYLAGGTGLALQLGHRDSVDFDFFIEGGFDTTTLLSQLESIFNGNSLVVTQQEINTISCLIDGSIQLSFLGYAYPLLKPLVTTEFFPIASVEDIGCMKFSAIMSRSVEKDYIDLYFILKQVSLTELLSLSAQKHPTLDATLVLKSLVYFDDVLREPILFKEGHDVSFEEVQAFLQKTVTDYFAR